MRLAFFFSSQKGRSNFHVSDGSRIGDVRRTPHPFPISIRLLDANFKTNFQENASLVWNGSKGCKYRGTSLIRNCPPP